MNKSGSLYGTNSLYLEDLYEQYVADKTSVPQHWQDFFADLGSPASAPATQTTNDGLTSAPQVDKQSRVSQLINAFRSHGHRRAHLNPLAAAPDLDDDLKPIAFGLTASDLDAEFATEGVLTAGRAPLRDIFEAVRNTYCRTIGVQFHDIPRPERLWLQERMERVQNRPVFGKEEQHRILKGLLVAERFENFLQKKFMGVKRFSLEGGESLIPMLDVMIDAAGAAGVTDVVMGMAHRGRLNVLVNILDKPLAEIFSEFAGTLVHKNDASSGDVKYHKGKSFDITTNKGFKLHVALLANPSHLEIVNPVVEGSARARQHLKGDTERRKVMPVLIHGDTAFIGQGVVPETLNLGTLPGFTTGGTVHVVINNQLGYTARPEDAFGTEYCTDFARMLQVPIFHVNGDDAEACIHVMQLAMDYRNRFQRDVVIDMVCYRKYGHNEGDDPTFTQPLMYEKIKAHPGTLELYRKQLTSRNVLTDEAFTELDNANEAQLQEALDLAKSGNYKPTTDMFGGVWQDFAREEKKAPATAIKKELLTTISTATTAWPEGFTPHPKLAKLMEKRAASLLDGEMDWGAAEMAAYASLLSEGHSLRLTGQDVKRGTFAHRHAVLVDYATAAEIMPMAELSADGAKMEVYNSSLSEEAVLGFEFGYALTDPRTLTVWEAQFGDFVNGAQAVIDQFIASSETKWHRMAGLVMLLPHGFEGQGPEHSSARLERFLQLCAEDNMVVCNPTTPAQMFHLLRRQMLSHVRRPLIVMTPKSLLRHPKAVSTPSELTAGHFQPVIADDSVKAKAVKRVVLCSGKVYYDLMAGRDRFAKAADKVALVRVEQLYPLPLADIKKILGAFSNKAEICWVQEEPRNQGSWSFMLDNLQSQLGRPLTYIGRVAAAAPAVGSPQRHMEEQEAIVKQVFDL